MRVLIVAMAITLLTVPAFAQQGAANGIGAASGAGRANQPPEAPKVDPAQQKADEKAFKEGVKRIPDPDKKFDPWGNLRQSGR
jgi:hypothetical protein